MGIFSLLPLEEYYGTSTSTPVTGRQHTCHGSISISIIRSSRNEALFTGMLHATHLDANLKADVVQMSLSTGLSLTTARISLSLL